MFLALPHIWGLAWQRFSLGFGEDSLKPFRLVMVPAAWCKVLVLPLLPCADFSSPSRLCPSASPTEEWPWLSHLSISPASLTKALFDTAGGGSRAGFALYKFVKVTLTISVRSGIKRIPLSLSLHQEDSIDDGRWENGLSFLGWFGVFFVLQMKGWGVP